MRVVENVMAFESCGHKFCLDSMFYHWNRSLCAATEKVKGVKGDSEGEKMKVSEAFEREDQTFLYIKRPGLYNCHSCHGDLFHVSVLEMTIHL